MKDGRRAQVDPLKSNWAVALAEPPFYGYAISCGITFTFGGLHVALTAGAVLGAPPERPPQSGRRRPPPGRTTRTPR